jgi:ribosome biogenesis GTPase / thiamine phosphate phosphatase
LSETLARFGWDPEWETEFEQHRADGLVPARVAVEHRSAYVLYGEEGEIRAELAGRLRHEDVWPAVGDWVGVRLPSTIAAVLPRRTQFSRKEPWLSLKEQVLAVNVDTVFVTTALTPADFKVRRIERYLATAWESGAQPAIALTKTDLCDNLEAALVSVEAVAYGVPVHAVNGLTGEGVEELEQYLRPNRTVAFLGSSGVGKSTIVNRLAGGEVMPTADVLDDGRGRHTTRHRELILLPRGGVVLDTPGLRELQLWSVESGLDTTFDDVTSLIARCRFSNCGHGTEPGCAVREALRTGALPRERYDSWLKLQRELQRLERKLDARARSEYGREVRQQARRRRRTQKPARRGR